MRISTSGRYALRAILDLALYNDKGPVLRSDIAARQEITADYIAQLFRRLTQKGLVRSVMGPGGGYVLGRAPAQITLGDIVRASEGPIGLVACVLPGGEVVCKRYETCVTRRVWARLSRSMEQFLDSITLQDLVDEALQQGPEWTGACSPVVEAFTDSLENPPCEGPQEYVVG